ncbi:hypothetical protein [Streptomyces sp. NPDC001340]
MRVFGILAGGWGLWLETRDQLDRAESRERITNACEGLVDPDQMLGLNGGTVRARAGSDEEDSMYDLDSPNALISTPTDCTIYRVGKPGTTYNHFLLSVWVNPNDRQARLVSGWDDPFQTWKRHADGDIAREAEATVPHPLGDGRLGVQTSVNTMTVAKYFEQDPVTDTDRRTLAELARTAAGRAAEKLGCKATLPAVPAELPTPSKRLVNAESAGGTCGWYVGSDSLDDVLRVAPFWLRTESYFGDEAGEVKTDHFGRDQRELPPGTTGSDGAENVWWASSTCDGEPAVHTLSSDYPYDRVVGKRLGALFKAYVTDVAARRHCTHLKFPSASTFVED